MLNRYDRPSPMAGEAEVKFLDGDFRIMRPGAFVRCAVTGVPIPLEELKYWSVDLQEPYATPEAVLRRHAPERKQRLSQPLASTQARGTRPLSVDLKRHRQRPRALRRAREHSLALQARADPSRW